MPQNRAAIRLAATARSQAGVFTRAQALRAGYSSAHVSRLVAEGVWHRWHPGVYSHATANRTWEMALHAALLAVGEDAAVARFAAAALWRMPDFDRTNRVELMVARRKLPRLEGVTVLGTSHLPDTDLTFIGGVRVTTFTRTVVDLCRVTRAPGCREPGTITPQRLVEAAADGYRRRRTDPERLAACAAAWGRLPGANWLRDVVATLDDAYAACRSIAEIRLHTILRTAGITGYRLNVRTRLSSGRVVVFDVLFDDLRLVIEVDGAAYHASVTARARDRARDAESEADGFLVCRIAVAELADPDAVLARVRSAMVAARDRVAAA